MIPSGSITVSSRRVLLIENSPSERQLLRNWLNAEMIETYEAVDIITAMSAFQKYSPNLILLQLRLPTWDGFEVIRRLKEDPRTRSVPVILLAATALTAEKAKGIDMGAVDFVSKPFDSVELLARVNSSLRTKALLDLLEQRAHLDGLTELGNRFALQDELPCVFSACRQQEMPLSISIVDIDHFKRINDHYGHAAGDEVLRRIAIVLKQSVRPIDFVARYGGEEFVVVSPNCDLKTALETAQTIRMRLADLAIGFRNSTIRLTASLGVAGVSMDYDGPPHEVLEKADQSLYRAKASGRNAVWHWDFETQCPVENSQNANPSGIASAMPGPPQLSLTARALASRRMTVTTLEVSASRDHGSTQPTEMAVVLSEMVVAWSEDQSGPGMHSSPSDVAPASIETPVRTPVNGRPPSPTPVASPAREMAAMTRRPGPPLPPSRPANSAEAPQSNTAPPSVGELLGS
jgi:diguanylate cyclase (GGDEF)-like protein